MSTPTGRQGQGGGRSSSCRSSAGFLVAGRRGMTLRRINSSPWSPPSLLQAPPPLNQVPLGGLEALLLRLWALIDGSDGYKDSRTLGGQAGHRQRSGPPMQSGRKREAPAARCASSPLRAH